MGGREDWLPNSDYAPNAENKRRQGFAFQHTALSGTLEQLLFYTKLGSPVPKDLLGFSIVAHKTRTPQKPGLENEVHACTLAYEVHAKAGLLPHCLHSISLATLKNIYPTI